MSMTKLGNIHTGINVGAGEDPAPAAAPKKLNLFRKLGQSIERLTDHGLSRGEQRAKQGIDDELDDPREVAQRRLDRSEELPPADDEELAEAVEGLAAALQGSNYPAAGEVLEGLDALMGDVLGDGEEDDEGEIDQVGAFLGIALTAGSRQRKQVRRLMRLHKRVGKMLDEIAQIEGKLSTLGVNVDELNEALGLGEYEGYNEGYNGEDA